MGLSSFNPRPEPMSLQDPRRLLIVCSAIVLSAIAPSAAFAQSGARPSISPIAPNDSSKPSFDTTKPTYSGTAPGGRAAETVVAEVDGHAITLAEVGDRIKQMPSNIANLPFEILFPNMVEQLVKRQALVLRAQRLGFEDDPVVRRRMRSAAEEVLANEIIQREAGQSVTDRQLQERYRRDHAGKPGADEVHVRVISVPTEEAARDAIDRLKGGADFATLAKDVSKDPSASLGGDLGFLTREALNPEIGAVAFALAPGQMSAYPVRSAGSWFVIRTEARRAQPTPSYAMLKEAIRQAMVREAAFPIIRSALADVTVREYDVGGKEFAAEPPATP